MTVLAISIQASVSVLRRCNRYPAGVSPGKGRHSRFMEDIVTEVDAGAEGMPGSEPVVAVPEFDGGPAPYWFMAITR